MSDDDDAPAGPPKDDATWGPLGEGEELLFEGRARGRPPLVRSSTS